MKFLNAAYMRFAPGMNAAELNGEAEGLNLPRDVLFLTLEVKMA
jgi:hypothetical protein